MEVSMKSHGIESTEAFFLSMPFVAKDTAIPREAIGTFPYRITRKRTPAAAIEMASHCILRGLS
jgi:hypothetical protein